MENANESYARVYTKRTEHIEAWFHERDIRVNWSSEHGMSGHALLSRRRD